MGQNGTGKSTLLKMLAGLIPCQSGDILTPKDLRISYVPQVIDNFDALSGGQRFNKALTQALANEPDLLLLDEPTNHLDKSNRDSLTRLLRAFPNSLVIVTHDLQILRTCVDRLWHIDNGTIQVFSGTYDDYKREIAIKRASLEQELSNLERQKKQAHKALMNEQIRAKHSRERGEKSIQQRKWPTIVSDSKARNAQETSGRKKRAIHVKKQEILSELSELRLPEIMKPKFHVTAEESNRTLLSVHQGSVAYDDNKPILTDITLSLKGGERLAIIGDNGTGKSTLVKAMLGDPTISKQGDWLTPNSNDIGYLDQHYATLSPELTVLESLANLRKDWSHGDLRRHLNDFLFRKNEEVNALIATLSGGEKARLSLAHIAAATPRLLILDEMTNNIDLETREHVIQVLNAYKGALVVISHDEDFLSSIGVRERLHLG
jgi:ATPase subunit of ABC transporter with duplicated ATPase domains